MKLGFVLRAAAIYMALVGLGVIFAPEYFGVGAMPADPSVELTAFLRVWGSPLLGIAVLNWMTRNAEPSKALDAIILGNIVGFGAIAAIDVWGALNGGRPLHRVFAVVHLLFALAFIWSGRAGRSSKSGRVSTSAAD